MHAIHLYKLLSNTYPSVTEMSSTQEMQCADRELLLELRESRSNLAFVHMSSPIPNGYDILCFLKINGEALWNWRELKMDAKRLIHALQNCFPPIGLKLNPLSEARNGKLLKRMVYYVVRRVTAEKSSEKRKGFCIH